MRVDLNMFDQFELLHSLPPHFDCPSYLHTGPALNVCYQAMNLNYANSAMGRLQPVIDRGRMAASSL